MCTYSAKFRQKRRYDEKFISVCKKKWRKIERAGVLGRIQYSINDELVMNNYKVICDVHRRLLYNTCIRNSVRTLPLTKLIVLERMIERY